MRKWKATGRKPNVVLGLLLPLVGLECLDLPFMEFPQYHKTHRKE